MKSMKKILTLLLVAVLAGAMATTASAAPETPAENANPIAAANESVLITANIEGNGQVAFSDYDSEPVFDNVHPKQSAFVNAVVGSTIRISAKADEGWRFAYWMNADTQEFISMDATISVEVTGAMNLKAVFADASLVVVTASADGNGQVAIFQDGSEPAFENDFPIQNPAVQAAVGDTVILSAKADEGWKFTEWKNSDTGEMYSTDAMITISVTEALNLTAVFEAAEENEPIRAEHTSINYGRNGDGIVINTTSKSDTVGIRIDGGTAATNETEGLTLENGTVKISKELANKILKDGENHLNLVFSDGTLEVVIYVTSESSAITPGTDVPKTGDATSAIAVSAVLISSSLPYNEAQEG